jgi:hypothetical protein
MNETIPGIAKATSEYLVKRDRDHLIKIFSTHRTLERINEALCRLTGIRHFFPDRDAFESFHKVLTLPVASQEPITEREWGDFQTPPALAAKVCRYLAEVAISPRLIIEPTYGTGNFILAALCSFPTVELVYGVEIQDKYEWHLKMALLDQARHNRHPAAEIELHQDNIFSHRFPDRVLKAQDILIIGNPPWVTSAELGALNAENLPTKRNIKTLNGLDALTGKSNFDIGEFILLRLLELFSRQRGTLAMLCKNSVVKNIVEALPHLQYKVSNIRAYGIDAKHEFGASVAASLLVLDMGASKSTFSCRLATFSQPNQTLGVFGWAGNKFVSNIEGYTQVAYLDGKSPFVWRQGLKHDCSKVMELRIVGGSLINGYDQTVEIENEWLYWLLKSSDLQTFEIKRASRKVIVPQYHLGQETSSLQHKAPKLWQYLIENSRDLDNRKSSIYRDRPPFSIFGIGDYSFKPYKVAISGLYKQPCFSLILPIDDSPVMLDDTCYFLGFDTCLDALLTASVLNSQLVRQFLQTIVFTEAKRPYTKRILMRIDLLRAASQVSLEELYSFWSSVDYVPHVPVTELILQEYTQKLADMRQETQILQLGLGI